MSKDLLEVILTTPVSYANKEGEQVESISVTMKAPSAKDIINTTILKQTFFKAISTIEGGESKEGEKQDFTGSDILSLMYMADVEMTKFMIAARELFTSDSEIVLLDGKVKLTTPLLNKISAEDFENMTGEFLSNFILASALQKMKSTK